MKEKEKKKESDKYAAYALRRVLMFSFGSVQCYELLLIDRWGMHSWQKLIDDFLTVTRCND